MEKGLIGIQMSTIKKKVDELGAYETLKACAELGYHCMEVSQIPMTPENVSGMRKACDEFGIKIAANSASLEPMAPGMPGEFLTTDFDKIVEDCKALNTDMLRIGMLPMTCMGSREKAVDFVKRADEMAERLGEHGIDLYYHNHHVEFVKYDGQYLLDIIKDNTKKMGFELDIHWIHRGGENPVTFINKYAGRIRLLHLKDYMRRKVADRAVILASDRKIWKQAAAFASCFPVKAYLVKEQELLLLYDYYCFEEYFDNVVFTFVSRPKDNLLERVLRETDVDEEEAVCLGLYCLRSADREGRG